MTKYNSDDLFGLLLVGGLLAIVAFVAIGVVSRMSDVPLSAQTSQKAPEAVPPRFYMESAEQIGNWQKMYVVHDNDTFKCKAVLEHAYGTPLQIVTWDVPCRHR